MIEDFSQLLKKVVSGDETSGMTLLSYFENQTISVEEQMQVHVYLKQAARESHHAIYLRGLLYEHAYGVKQDFDMAFLLMREAASKGNAKATYAVGCYFLQGLGVEKNYHNALQWLKIAAGSPHYVAQAMYDLGYLYQEGLGVEVDLKQAQAWYEKAANKGYLPAKEKLAIK